jgi:predicted RNA-binding Zn-ribbon protein involved in translation (DUF1610 family)
MSIVEIRCPRCGSPCTVKSSKTNEYICSNCGTAFAFVDTSRPIVTTDIHVHNCPLCGKPIEAGKGFKCTRCGREYICDSCVDEVDNKYVCIECIEKSNQNCQLCKRYAVYKCISCGRRACKTHALHVGFIKKYGASERVLFCPNCRGFVCNSCLKYGFLSRSVHCPKCDSGLIYYSPYK